MTSTEDLIKDRIAEAFEHDPIITLLDDREYGNTGTFRTINAATLKHIASTTYAFHNNYCTFGPMSARLAAYWYDKPITGREAAWVATSLSDVIDRVITHLRGTP